MANTFKNASTAIQDGSGTVLYTTPASTTSVVHSLFITNITSVEQTVEIRLEDSSASTNFRFGYNLPVPADSTLFYAKPINLETGDAVRLIASNASALEAVASVLEIT